MPCLTRSQILATPIRTVSKVACPEWGDDAFVMIRSLTSSELDDFERKGLDEEFKPDMSNYRARLAAVSVCDESAELLFSEDDAAALGNKYSSVLDRICDRARELSKMNKKDLERSRKNS